MKIGIIVAMGKELKLLLDIIDGATAVESAGYSFHTGRIGNSEVVAMQCGIGKVNAAMGTIAMIDAFAPQIIINTGVAGGTGATNVLDVVLASEIAYHDVWCGPGTVPGQAANCPARFATAVDAAAVAEKLGARTGLIASGDIFVSRPEDVKRILDLYPDAVAVDMESAAIAQVCYLRGVPFVCLRVVSDTPGKHDDNAAQYTDFWTEAPARTFQCAKALIEILEA